jgi:hypothetical protein
MNLGSIRVRLLLLFSALALGMAWYLFANVSGEIGKLREGGAHRGSQRGRRGEQRAGA